MGNRSTGNQKILLFLTAFCGAFFLYYLDRLFFRLILSIALHPLSIFHFIFGYGIETWHRILRLIFAFVTGFLFYLVLERKKSFLLSTWICWQIFIYIFYIILFEKPLWFIQDPIYFAWRMLTILPFFLGANLTSHFFVLAKKLSSNIAKGIVIGFGIVAIVLSVSFYVRIMTSDGYRAAREFRIDIPLEAKSVHKSWNPFSGVGTIDFKIEMENPASLVHYYDQKLNWQIMPSIVFTEELGWQFEPGREWEWTEVPSEWEIHKDVRGFGYITWIHYEEDIFLSIGIKSKREDPQNLFEVTLLYGPVFYNELMKRFKHGK